MWLIKIAQTLCWVCITDCHCLQTAHGKRESGELFGEKYPSYGSRVAETEWEISYSDVECRSYSRQAEHIFVSKFQPSNILNWQSWTWSLNFRNMKYLSRFFDLSFVVFHLQKYSLLLLKSDSHEHISQSLKKSVSWSFLRMMIPST